MALYTVTGGAGFIGSHLVDEILRRGHQARIVDNLSTGKRRNLPTGGHFEFIEGDVADPAVARRAAAGAECQQRRHPHRIPVAERRRRTGPGAPAAGLPNGQPHQLRTRFAWPKLHQLRAGRLVRQRRRQNLPRLQSQKQQNRLPQPNLPHLEK